MINVTVTLKMPDQIFDFKKFERKLTTGMDVLLNETAHEFKLTADTWMHKPEWRKQRAARVGDSWLAWVYTDDENLSRVNFGTPRHDITARRAPLLRFRHGSGFRAKTQPGVVGSAVGANTGRWVRKKTVSHPGIKARRFDLAIAKGKEKDLLRIANEALKAAVGGK